MLVSRMHSLLVWVCTWGLLTIRKNRISPGVKSYNCQLLCVITSQACRARLFLWRGQHIVNKNLTFINQSVFAQMYTNVEINNYFGGNSFYYWWHQQCFKCTQASSCSVLSVHSLTFNDVRGRRFLLSDTPEGPASDVTFWDPWSVSQWEVR